MKKLILLLLLVFPLVLMAQDPDALSSVLKTNEPIYIVDSVKITKAQLDLIKPDDVLEVMILKNPGPLETSNYGRRGVLFVTTKQFGKKVYLEKFSRLSAEYKKYITDKNNNDDSITYVINGQKVGEGANRLNRLYTTSGKAIEGFIFRQSNDGLTATATISIAN